MLVEQGMRVLNTEMVREADAVADNFFNDRLLGIVVQLFQRGEVNRLKRANRAIAMFESELA